MYCNTHEFFTWTFFFCEWTQLQPIGKSYISLKCPHITIAHPHTLKANAQNQGSFPISIKCQCLHIKHMYVAQSRANTNIKPMQQESSLFSQCDSSCSLSFLNDVKLNKRVRKERMKICTQWGRVAPLFPLIKYATVPQHGPFSLYTMFDDSTSHKLGIPSPLVWPLDDKSRVLIIPWSWPVTCATIGICWLELRQR